MIRCMFIVCLISCALVGCGRLTGQTRIQAHRAPIKGPILVRGIMGDPFRGAPPAVNNSTPAREALLAAAQGDEPKLKRIVEKGADLNALDPAAGMTPLHIAVSMGKDGLNAARLLLEAGADPNVQMKGDGPTPLYDAVASNDADMVELLLKHGAIADVYDRGSGSSLVGMAAVENQTRILRALIDAHADVNHGDNYGVTPLHLAASKAYTECVEMLTRAEADVNARTKKGVSVLEVAERRPDRPEIIDLLKRLGAK